MGRLTKFLGRERADDKPKPRDTSGIAARMEIVSESMLKNAKRAEELLSRINDQGEHQT